MLVLVLAVAAAGHTSDIVISVAMARVFCSCRKSNKTDKNVKIFEHIDLPKSQWVLCQH
jgi:methylphosphotriester-DNA--protein-cysteine methyltransferase